MPVWIVYILMLLGGVVVLGGGGEALVRGAGRLARTLGMSSLVVGLTVVAFGTSAPEAAVTIFAASQGAGDLAVGNVVGSNIANLLLILGFAAVVKPLGISRSLLRLDGPVMILASVVFLVLAARNHVILRWEGGLFVAGLVVYTLVTYQVGRRSAPRDDEASPTGVAGKAWYNLVLVAGGIGGLVLGAKWIVDGASGIAALLGVPPHIIGLTIVAIGTSLPELATVVAAARQSQPDIAIGNVVGSNIFNILFVTGCASTVRPLAVPSEIVHTDGPLMVLVSLLAYLAIWTGQKVVRWEGVVLLAGYVAYLTWAGSRAL